MTSKFNLGLGAFFPQKSFKIQVDGSVPGDYDVDKTDWRGQVETGQAGPRLTLTAAW